MSIKVSPSILAADFGNIERECDLIDKSDADWFHLDVMDGIFVPNISFGMPIVKAIRKMTSFPAQRLGLKNRGLIKEGFKADLVLFNPETVKAPATKSNPKQYPIGIDYVIVNGQVVIENGENTGILAGRSLRRGRD